MAKNIYAYVIYGDRIVGHITKLNQIIAFNFDTVLV